MDKVFSDGFVFIPSFEQAHAKREKSRYFMAVESSLKPFLAFAIWHCKEKKFSKKLERQFDVFSKKDFVNSQIVTWRLYEQASDKAFV